MTEKAANTALSDMTKTELAKRDYVILVDKSGSMGDKDCPGGLSRWDWAKEQTMALVRKCMEFDNNGVTVGLFSSKWTIKENITDADGQLKAFFDANEPSGNTDTAGVLEEVLGAYLKERKNGAKPITVLVVTDGAPNSKEAVRKVIIDAANTIESDDEIGISFIQVGKNDECRAFLKELDDDLQDEGAKFDIVDTKNDEEMADMTLTDILVAAITD